MKSRVPGLGKTITNVSSSFPHLHLLLFKMMLITDVTVWLWCSYYSLEDISHESMNKYLSNLVERSLRDLECSYCIQIKEVCCSAGFVLLVSEV